MTDLSPIIPKLQHMIRMMGSDIEGEALGAVHGIRRTLMGAGADFHDLADAIGVKRPELGEALGYGEEYWQPPKPKHGNNDFVPPKRRQRPPRPAGPPIWEEMEKAPRLAWLDAMVRSERVSTDQKVVAAALRGRYYSQPQVQIKPAQRAEINCIFAAAWIADVRPVADVLPGDNRQPLMWTGQNRDHAKRVLQEAARYLPHKDRVFAESIVTRIDSGPQTLAMLSIYEVERIDRILVASYDLGARP